MTDYQLAALTIALFLGGIGSFALGWLCRSIVADKQLRDLIAESDRLRRDLEQMHAEVWEAVQKGRS